MPRRVYEEEDDDDDDGRNASAPLILLNAVDLTSIELPGPCAVGNLPTILDRVGGPVHFAAVLNAHNEQPNSILATPELHLRPDDMFAHPVAGAIFDTNNLVLKITKRRRKEPLWVAADGSAQGIFVIEHVGNVRRTVRFRDLQDYQYAAPMDDPSVQLAEAMRKLDVSAMTDFAFPEPSEDPVDDMRLLPPPLFSRIPLPQWYGFRKNPQTKAEQVTNARGEEVERMRNTSRYALIAPISINFSDEHVPDAPPAGVKEGVGTEPSLIARLTELLDQRPVWTRLALLNQLSPDHHRNVIYNKQALPFLTYTFNDGPFRELVIRFGYDPRRDPDARFNQRIQLRNTGERQMKPKAGISTVGPRAANVGLAADINRLSHIFDGSVLNSSVGTFQLCDLTDPLLSTLVREPRFFRSTCHPGDGWWVADFMDHLRNILKQKYVGLANGRPVDDLDLGDDIERIRALPIEGEGGSGAELSEESADSDLSDGTGRAMREKKALPPKKKEGKRKPKAKMPDIERELPLALATGLEAGSPDSEAAADD